MKARIILLLLIVPLSLVMNAQKKPAAKAPKVDPEITFDERFSEILKLVTTANTEALGKETGLVGAVATFGTSYPVKAGKALPFANNEEYTWYQSPIDKWEYRAEFGKYKPGQEAAQQAMEEKITRLVLAGLAKTDWKEVTSTKKNDDKTKELLHYNKLTGGHHIRLKVSKRSSGNIIILTWG